MKIILHVISGLQTGGAERMLVKLVQQTKEDLKHEIVVLKNKNVQGAILEQIGVPIHELNINNAVSFFVGIKKLATTIKKTKPDIIQGWMYHGNLFAVLAGVFSKKPRVVFNIRHSMHGLEHEKLLTRLTIKLNAFLSKYSQGVIYNSHNSKDQHEKINFRASNAFVISNGFDEMIYFKDKDSREELLNELNIPKNNFIFGKVGRNHPMKNHIGFLESVAKVIKEKKNVHFIIVGRDITSDLELQSYINENGLMGYVTLIEERNDMERFMNILDCLVVNSSWGEAFPNVIGEAMLCEKPCIVTDVGDCKRIIADTGISIAADNTEELSVAMQTFVNMKKEDLTLLGINARIRIIQNYSMKKIAEYYFNLYISILEKETDNV